MKISLKASIQQRSMATVQICMRDNSCSRKQTPSFLMKHGKYTDINTRYTYVTCSKQNNQCSATTEELKHGIRFMSNAY